MPGFFVPLPKIKNHGRKQIRPRINQRVALMGAGYPKQQDLPGRGTSPRQMHQSNRLQKSYRGDDSDDLKELGESNILPNH